jgi:predicted lipoprotein with Yx(FWY)xxD motif
VKVATTAYGKILETPSGQVLYALTANTPTKSACSGACLTIWPPLTVSGTPVAGSGVTSSDLGTFALSTGKSQVTYGGHQLYEYSGDTAAGQTNGEGLSFPVGASSPTGHWYVVSSSGAVVTSAVSSTSKSTTPTTAKSTSKSTSGNGY